MKNKVLLFNIIYLIFLFFVPNFVLSNEFKFNASQIESYNNGNLIKGFKGINVIDETGLTITAEEFEFDKIKSILEVTGNVIIKDKINKNVIKTNQVKFYKKLNVIISNGATLIELANNHFVEGSNITFDKNLNKIYSKKKALITDVNNNKIKMSKFTFLVSENILEANFVEIIDNDQNIYEIESIRYNLDTGEVVGKDLLVNFNNKNFNSNQNEPRLKGNAIFQNNRLQNNKITKISKGVFTTCKKNDTCPPWSISSEEITHDKTKQIISYKKAWLKIYDVPVVYFPKFFHPDPSVKRQSGFLVPQFSQSSNFGSYYSMPYFKVISDATDLTFTPRFYENGDTIYQGEYRNNTQKTKNVLDFSIKNKNPSVFEKNNKSTTHFFLKSEIELGVSTFEETKIDLQIQQTSSDNYLKTYKVKSPLMNSADILHSRLNFKGSNKDLEVEVTAEVYENLGLPTSDRYEYIFPSFDILKNIKEFDTGILSLKSSGYSKQSNSNTNENILINDFTYSSDNKIGIQGLMSTYQILLKNFNAKTNNSATYKNKRENDLQSLFNYELKYPLQKTNKNYLNTLTPIISARYSPNKSKNKLKEDRIINYDNIFSINRIGLSDTVEGGESLTIGSEYAVFDNLNNNKKLFSLNLATVLRTEENEKLPKNSSIGKKSSDIFGGIDFNPNEFIELDYNFSLDNNLDTANYNQVKSTFTVNNFVSTFDFLEKKTFSGGESYIANETKYDIGENSSLGFKTRKNKDKDLTEYYNWIYQYKNDCLVAGIEYKKDFYSDGSLKPEEQLFFSITIMPLGSMNSPNIN